MNVPSRYEAGNLVSEPSGICVISRRIAPVGINLRRENRQIFRAVAFRFGSIAEGLERSVPVLVFGELLLEFFCRDLKLQSGPFGHLVSGIRAGRFVLAAI